ncbi:hypothetical protein BOX15_Mlig012247g1 [Macrostomum lignano]|uniref:DNA ligase n=1 Tax=Macrostomum lignano TaxID=282301 RepID=A0A267FBZ4_9PLAT|nr:hypothetical protein BOX15_Mlig012247g1 [Macrostomum lignano]
MSAAGSGKSQSAEASAGSPTVASRVPFNQLAGLLERVSRLRGHKEKLGPIKEFMATWRQLHTELHGPEPLPQQPQQQQDSFYPAMRLLLPLSDRARPAYGIKEFMLAKIYIEILCLGRDSPEAKKLLNYKNPGQSAATTGDFAATAYFILQHRCPRQGALTVQQVNNHLTAMSAANAANKRDEVKRQLFALIKQTTALEQKWLIRIVLRDIRAGVSEKTVLSAFHPDAEALYDVTQSLEKVCTSLHYPGVRLHEIGVALNTPFRPMLGEAASVLQLGELFAGRPFLLEVKFDGERMQLHKSGSGYRYWSRSGLEWTATYGAAPDGPGNLTPHVASAFLPGVDNCILDGEMMGFNLETNTMGSKAQDFDIKRVSVRGYVPCFVVFDLILLNGRVLTDRPLVERKRILDNQVLAPVPGRLLISEWSLASTQAEAVEKFNAAIESREEGLMAKLADSVYSVASRKAGWFKLKPEFVGGLVDDVDCVIVGGYFGSGHRAGMCSHFLCALPDVGEDDVGAAGGGEDDDGDAGASVKYLSFCKVGSGYSKQTLFEYNMKMAQHWQRFDKRSPPEAFRLADGQRERPDVWIDPSNSFVVQVRASEIVASDAYATGYTLRFPRVVGFREDKTCRQATSVAQLTALRLRSQGKLARSVLPVGGNRDDNDCEDNEDGAAASSTTSPPGRKRQRRAPVARAAAARPQVGSQFVGVSAAADTAGFLTGCELMVLNGLEAAPKAELERRVLAAGGRVVQNPGRATRCVVAHSVNARARNLIASGRHDVATADWLLASLEAGRLLPLTRQFVHFARPATLAKEERAASAAVGSHDEFGDSYTKPVTPQALGELLDKTHCGQSTSGTAAADDYADDDEVEAEWPTELLPDDVGLPLAGCTVYLDCCLLIGDPTTRRDPDGRWRELAADVRRAGGRLAASLTPSVTHAVVRPDEDASRLRQIREAASRDQRRRIHVVTADWVTDSCRPAGDDASSVERKCERLYMP